MVSIWVEPVQGAAYLGKNLMELWRQSRKCSGRMVPRFPGQSLFTLGSSPLTSHIHLHPGYAFDCVSHSTAGDLLWTSTQVKPDPWLHQRKEFSGLKQYQDERIGSRVGL